MIRATYYFYYELVFRVVREIVHKVMHIDIWKHF